MVISFKIKLFARHLLKIAHIQNRASHHLKKSDRWTERTAIIAVAIFAFTSITGFYLERNKLATQPTQISAISSSSSSKKVAHSLPVGSTGHEPAESDDD